MKRGSSERTLVSILARTFGDGAARASLGIGDDAAVLRKMPGRVVWTVDTAIEGVHFDRRWLSLADIGARSFHAAVSDVAAMGARPFAALSNLVVPGTEPASIVRGIARGQAEAARALDCPVVGGNLSRGRDLGVTTTVIGVLGAGRRPACRSGARPGDELWLVGDLGLAAAGLRFLAAGRSGSKQKLDAPSRRAVAACVAAWRRPHALVRDGIRLARSAHAVIDVSDGLSGDAAHLSEASGVSVVVDEAALRRVLRPELLRTSALLGSDALALALNGGEDYALLAAGPAAARPRIARRIGSIEEGSGVRVRSGAGARKKLASLAFDHFC